MEDTLETDLCLFINFDFLSATHVYKVNMLGIAFALKLLLELNVYKFNFMISHLDFINIQICVYKLFKKKNTFK